MVDKKPIEIEIQNKSNGHTIDIMEKLTNFISYLKYSNDCQMLLKPSETE